MENQLTIKFNDKDYTLIYNEQSGYYETDLQAPNLGGVYNIDITFRDIFGEIYTDEATIQVLAKEPIRIEQNKVFMWIFDYFTFKVKDIVELSKYEINIDEETNSNTILHVLKKTTAKARDIIVIKKNNKIIYWGTINNIQNTDGQNLYEYIIKYATNLFDQDIILNPQISVPTIEEGKYNIIPQYYSDKYIGYYNSNVMVEDTSYNWKLEKVDDKYVIRDNNTNKVLTVENLINNATIIEQEYSSLDTQLFTIEHLSETKYRIKIGSYFLTTDSQTGNLKIYNDLGVDSRQTFIFARLDELIIKDVGIEDFIAKKIEENFINSEDTFINKLYMQVVVKTHTKKQTSVTNVENNIFNLHTYMTNCTQNYDIVYSFSIVNKKFVITIENKAINKELIDVNAQPISNYNEVFETDIVSKVVVLTSTNTYTLYLLNNRTTTTDMTNPNRAEGKTVTVYTENYEDAPQTALDQIKQNAYNHKITFNYYDRLIPVGTPIAIKTKQSLIFDTYISAVKIMQSKFIEYTCGNIRVKFIDKLLKERSR